MTVEPSWPRTPSGSGRRPARFQMTSPMMMVAAVTRLAVTRLAVTTPAGPARQRDHGRDGGQVVAHDDDVGGVQSKVRADRPIATPALLGGQGRGFVDPVACQQDSVAFCFQESDGGGLALRQHARADVGDTDLPGQPPRGALVVAGHQDWRAGDRGDAGGGRGGRGAGAVGGAEKRGRDAVDADHRCGLPAVLHRSDFDPDTFRPGSAEQIMRATSRPVTRAPWPPRDAAARSGQRMRGGALCRSGTVWRVNCEVNILRDSEECT